MIVSGAEDQEPYFGAFGWKHLEGQVVETRIVELRLKKRLGVSGLPAKAWNCEAAGRQLPIGTSQHNPCEALLQEALGT